MENSILSNVIILTINKENKKTIENLISSFHGYVSKTTLPEELVISIKDNLNIDSATKGKNIKNMVIILNKFDAKKEELEALSQRENEVLSEIAHGKKNKQIAETLYVSVNTIRFHIKNIYKKLKVTSRIEATAFAFNKELI